ncbi:DUF1428 family protein [Sporosarcina koreensis]|uniref:DUF1428 family protein n=1 Tax=Sporosarcina koreensis TaxID=334735 RepID=A0ABW0TWN5_9BACL
MYSVIYLYPVPKQSKEEFIEINKRASLIYKEFGAIEDDTFQSTNIAPMYGCEGMKASVVLHENETMMLSISTFNSRNHHDMVMGKVDRDKEILELYNKMINIIDINRVVRGEFEKV